MSQIPWGTGQLGLLSGAMQLTAPWANVGPNEARLPLVVLRQIRLRIAHFLLWHVHSKFLISVERQNLTLPKKVYFIVWLPLLSGGKVSGMLLQSKLSMFYYAEIINIS